MIDFTKEIKLEKKWQKRYLLLRLTIFLIFGLIVIFVLYKILFPSDSFIFSFDKPDSTKNTIINPRDKDGTRNSNGKVNKDNVLFFNTDPYGIFSNIKISINEKSDEKEEISREVEVKVKKSFQSFFYPEGNPMGFKNGSLLKEGLNYYIISENKARKFSSEDIISKMGFNKKAFIEIDSSELIYNEKGYDISQIIQYPEDTLFNISEEYYQLKNGQLVPFVSEKAYITEYSKDQSIQKDSSFLKNYNVSEDFIGFKNGTLLSSDVSVYIVTEKKSYPINNPRTFEVMGYDWNDVIPANSEEISIYEKQKIFTMGSPHPNGTVFKTTDTQEYYYIQDGKKRSIKGENILKNYLNKNPILIEKSGLEEYAYCRLKKSNLIFEKYSCSINIEKIENFRGNNYLFEINTKNSIELSNIKTVFEQTLEYSNLRRSLVSLKNRIISNYK